MVKIPISSLDDPRIEPYRDLKDRKSQRRTGRFIVEGKWLTERLLESDYLAESILVADGHTHHIPALPEVPIYVLPRRQLDRLVGFQFHRGILACGRRKPPLSLGALMPPSAAPALIVVCAAVADLENLGGILRNCAAFGVDGVVLGPHCADPLARRTVRVSMGSVLKLKIYHSQILAQDLAQLWAEHRIRAIAAVIDDAALPLSEFTPKRRSALVFGNEGHGIDPRVLGQCGQKLTIPMSLGTDSLNVAVASGIILCHFRDRLPGR